jgi:hypothetical protein
MGISVITVPFDFDGETLSRGNVKFSVDRCDVEGIAFYVPPQYGLLLLKEETKVEAEKLLKELTATSINSDIQRDLLKEACEKGFKIVWLKLQQYKQHVPNSEPKFYAELSYDRSIDKSRITLVTAEKALLFYKADDLDPTLSQLPPNVYDCSKEYTRYDMNLARYRWLIGKEKEFIKFVEELRRYSGYIRGDAQDVCFDKFFENTAAAYELLKQIRDRASSRESRDQLFQTLESKKFLEFSEGLFVRDYWSTYYVSKNGEVYKLDYSKKVDEREAVFRAYEKGKVPTKLEEVQKESVLREIAEVVGKVRPELVFVILP